MRELTDAALRALKPPEKGRLELWDARQRNLVLRVTASGVYAWSVPTRTKDGRRTRVALGRWPEIGIAEARRRAAKAMGAIAAGADPMAEQHDRRRSREARAKELTVAERLTEWRQAKERDWSERYAREVGQIAAKDIEPALGKRPLSETTRADWVDIVAAKRKRAPAMASALYRVCSAFLNHAEASGWIAVGLLPRKGLATLAPTVAARARVLSDDELVAVWRASAALNPKPRAFVRLLILTAAREMEVADIAIGEVDRDAGQWRLPAERAKNGRALTLPLGPLALAELAAVWPNQAPPSYRRLLGVRHFSRLKNTIDKASGVADWRWHDLRRTARTGMTRLGVARDHAEAALNHVSHRSALEQTYDRHEYSAEILAASLRWQEHVAAMAVRPAAEVIQLPHGGRRR